MTRRANRKDANHQDIVKGLRAHGLTVFDMPTPGDVLVHSEPAMMRAAYVIDSLRGLPNRSPLSQADKEILITAIRMLASWVGFVPMEFKSSKAIRGKAENISNNKVKAPTPIPVVHDLAEALALFGLTE